MLLNLGHSRLDFKSQPRLEDGGHAFICYNGEVILMKTKLIYGNG